MKLLQRPNVLLIYTDQQRRDSLGCFGNELAKTPNLDKLAGRGVRFDRFFTQNTACMPSRMSFLTGRYCSSLGVGVNGSPFPEREARPLNRILSPFGYRTAQIGKLHFQPHASKYLRDPHPDYGFETFILSDESGCYDDAYTKWVEALNPDMLAKVRTSLPPEAKKYWNPSYSEVPRGTHQPYIFQGEENYTHSAFVASEICNYIKRNRNKTFFAIAGFYAPHPPINPPERFVEMYDSAKMPLPKLGEDESFVPYLRNVSEDKWREIAAYYLALVSHVDDCAGQIIRALEEAGIFENTVVVFTSDHGEYLGDHGLVGKGMPGYDCITRVPCILTYPREVKPGMVVEELAEAVDILPTILDYCGIQKPPEVQGKSLKGLLEGRTSSHREDVLTEWFSHTEPVRETTIRTANYKYYCGSQGKELLYDLRQDPYELREVSGDGKYRKVLSDMRKRMIVRIQDAAYTPRKRLAAY